MSEIYVAKYAWPESQLPPTVTAVLKHRNPTGSQKHLFPSSKEQMSQSVMPASLFTNQDDAGYPHKLLIYGKHRSMLPLDYHDSIRAD